MKALYFDCSAGVSGDMVCKALMNLGLDEVFIQKQLSKLVLEEAACEQDHGHPDHGHHHHRSYEEIKGIFENSHIGRRAKQIALDTYAVIAKAEAKVHNETLETVHFHEVGRDQAVRNIAAIGICIEALGVSDIYCSVIHDGTGFIECSHGKIPVPVPAVMAMREDCRLEFAADNIETEMVTPSGLAALIGMGAVYGQMPRGEVIAEGIGCGKRVTGKGGLNVSLIHI